VNISGSKTSLGQQLALICAGTCLLIGLALVTLASISSRHMQLSQQEEYGTALAQLIAIRINTALETGDLLSIAASLQRFVSNSSAEKVEIFVTIHQKLYGARAPVITRFSRVHCGLSHTCP